MKKLIALILALILSLTALASFASCNGQGKDPAASTTPSDSGGEKPAGISLPLIKNGKPSVYITVPENATRFVGFAREELQASIKEKFGVSILGGTMSDQEYEICLGNVDGTAAELISALGDSEFAIKTSGNKIYVVAKNDACLLDAVKYFFNTYLTSSDFTSGDQKNLTLTSPIFAVQRADTDTLFYSLAGDGLEINATVEEVVRMERYSADIYRKQGGCFTGKYFYQAFISQDENLAVIGRISLKTGDVAYSKPMNLGHANDIACNEEKGEIYVGSSKTVYVFDMDTLELKKTVSTPYSASRIAYSPEKNEFVMSSFYRVKSDLVTSVGKSFTEDSSVSSYTTQGITADGHYVYSLLCKSLGNSLYDAFISVYDWNGAFVGVINVDIPGNYEPENISVVDGELYIGNCSGTSYVLLYKVIIE